MSQTAEQILDIAEELMRQGGFHAFSFQDIADRIGIKKASIYYHHPAKAALGREVIARYRRRFRQAVETAETEAECVRALEAYLAPIVQIAESEAGVCLCAVLGGELLALPQEMREEVAAFYEENQGWLARLLEKGRAAGAFAFPGDGAAMARLAFSALEGAMLIGRATGDPEQFRAVLATLRRTLGLREEEAGSGAQPGV